MYHWQFFNMWSSNDVLEHEIVNFVGILDAFELQCSAKLYQVSLATFPSNSFLWLFMVSHSELIPPDSQRQHIVMNIRFANEPTIFCSFLCGYSLSGSTFRPPSWLNAKTFLILLLEQFLASKMMVLNVSWREFIRNPIVLVLQHIHSFKTVSNCVLSQSKGFGNSCWILPKSEFNNACN